MNRQWMVVLGVIAALAAGAYALVRFGPESTGVEIGKKAPDFRLVDVATGDSVSLRTLARGDVALINIWATWCAPCKEEMPAMQRTYVDLAPRGFRILAVSIDNGDVAPVKSFAQELGITFDILQDQSGRIQQLYQTTGVPESFLLDRDGTIVKRVIGAHDWASGANRKLIERYLDGGRVSVARTAPPGPQ
jgi:cytochrome c biogenesis protein CcmG/thiol:disulfide interchange protein DsbE